MYKHILMPTDGSELSQAIIPQVLGLAKVLRARVTAVNVSPRSELLGAEPMIIEETETAYRRQCQARAEEIFAPIRAQMADADIIFDAIHVLADQPYDAIIGAATEHACDLVVMASHGRRGVAALLLGSETNKVLTHSKIPVLVLR